MPLTYPITTKDAAGILQLSDSHIRRLCIASEGKIGTKRGHDWWLSAGDVARLKKRPRRGKYQRSR